MRSILCYGDSNTWGAAPMTGRDEVRRFGPETRWAGVLRRRLGDGFWVVEEGLNGRTTVRDDPIEGVHKNGRTTLRPCLESHAPLDLVIVMLGTNDLKHRFGQSAADIADGAGVLLDDIAASGSGPGWGPPSMLLVCPPPLARLTWLAEMFAGGAEKSRRLAGLYATAAVARGAAFMDAGEVIVSSDTDGIHFDAAEHVRLGEAVADRVRALLEAAP